METKTNATTVAICNATLKNGNPCKRKATIGAICSPCQVRIAKEIEARVKQERKDAIAKLDTPAQVSLMVSGKGEQTLYTALASVAGNLHSKSQDKLYRCPATFWLRESATDGWVVSEKSFHMGKAFNDVCTKGFSSKRISDELVITLRSLNDFMEYSAVEANKGKDPIEVLEAYAENFGCGWSRDINLGSTVYMVKCKYNIYQHEHVAALKAEAYQAKKATL